MGRDAVEHGRGLVGTRMRPSWGTGVGAACGQGAAATEGRGARPGQSSGGRVWLGRRADTA